METMTVNATGFSSNSASAGNTEISRKTIAAAVAGNAFEFYDFIIYSFFAVYISKAFFPASTPLNSLLLTLAVFGAGFISRPIGSLLIGSYADRAGRKPAMLLSISLMAIGTVGLAITPTYESIGLTAPIIIVVCRLLQGVALGGEIGPSTAFLIEAAPNGKRGLFGSWQLASQGVATLFAGIFGVALTLSLSAEQLQNWGWRIPFAFGVLIIPVAIYLRKNMPETIHKNPKKKEVNSVRATLPFAWIVFLGMIVVIGATTATYVSHYMTTYAIQILKLPSYVSISSVVAVGFCTLAFGLLGGWLSDRYGRRVVMLVPRILTALFIYPAFLYLIEEKTFLALMLVSSLMASLTAVSGAASFVGFAELLPRHIRAFGVSFSYAVGVGVFGGSTQFVVTWLIDVTGNPAFPAWYVVGTSSIAAVAIYFLPKFPVPDSKLPH